MAIYERSNYFLLVLVSFVFLSTTNGVDVYVEKNNNNGKKEGGCGSKENACPTIQAAVDNAKPNSYIYIKASESPYNECPIVVRKPFTFIGYGGTPVIDCETGANDAFKIKYINSDNKTKDAVRTTMNKVRIRNARTAVHLDSINRTTILQVHNATFQDNGADIRVARSRVCKIALTNVTMTGNHGYSINIDDTNQVKVELNYAKVHGKYFRIVSTVEALELRFFHTSFNMSLRTNISKDEAALHIETCPKKTIVNVQNSVFSDHVGEAKGFCYITNQRNIKQAVKGASNMVLTFSNVTFLNNSATDGSGGAVMLSTTLTKKNSPPGNLNFINCKFLNNYAYYHGGAMTFGRWVRKTVRFFGCIFKDNHAHGPELGQGGAIFSQGGKYIIIESQFSQNSAAISGGTLHFDQCTTKINDSSFENSPMSRDIQGDVLFMTRGNTLFYKKVTFDLHSANFQKSIIYFKGDSFLLFMTNFTKFTCPSGYNYEELDHMIKKRELVYSFFGFKCVACNHLFYSVSRGYYQMNGSSHAARCRRCPYGAFCNGTIHARANFWGQKEGDVVQMYPCPAGYCCDKETCDSYNFCQPHRTGTLCGQCEDGFSDRISLVSCHPNRDCSDGKLWLIFVEILVIVVFLMFHQEIVTMISSKVCPGLPENQQFEEREELGASTDGVQPVDHGGENIQLDTNFLLSQNSACPVYSSPSAPDPMNIEESAPYNHSSGYLKVFFYFFQILIFLRDSHSSFPNKVLEFLTPFINFQFSDALSGCLFKNWTPITKTLFKNTLCFWIFTLLLLSYALYRILRPCVKKISEEHRDEDPASRARSYPVRIFGCVVQVVLLSYLALVQLCASLLNCVHVGKQHVLYLDGTLSCYQPIQVFVWFYFVTCLCFLPVVLVFGRKQLIVGTLSPQMFLLFCFLPPLFLVKEGLRRTQKCKKFIDGDNGGANNMKAHKEKILYILQYPYKEAQSRENITWRELMAENWECVLLVRRLLIVTVSIFVKSYLTRSCLILFFSFCIVMHHFLVQPFVNPKANKLEMLSLCLIFAFTAIDVAKVSFAVSGTEARSQVALIQKLRDIFLVILLFLGVVGLFLIFLYRRWRNRLQKTTNCEATESNGRNPTL